MYHDHETAGHPGKLKTYNSVQQHYWWPGLRMFVKNYVQGCGACQQFKINRSPSNPAYQAIKGAKTTRPFAHCSMDLITDLLPVDEFDSILVVVDRGLSKGIILCPCAKTLTWEGAATLLRDNFQKIWTTRRNNLWQGSTICCTHVPRTLETVKHQIKLDHRLSSTVGWSHRTNEPGDRSLSLHLLYFSSRRLATFPKHSWIHTQ